MYDFTSLGSTVQFCSSLVSSFAFINPPEVPEISLKQNKTKLAYPA